MAEQTKSPERSPDYDLGELKLAAIIGYKVHFIVYLGVNALLLLINLACFSKTQTMGDGTVRHKVFIEYLWVMWPICGWGIGLIIHYLFVRKFSGPLVDSWTLPKVEDVLKQEKEQESPVLDLNQMQLAADIGFQVHLIVYLGVNALLLLINLACFSRTQTMGDGTVRHKGFMEYFWVMWPICGWGLGVLIQYLFVRKFSRPAQPTVS